MIKHCIIKCKNTYTYSSNQNWKVLEGQLWMEKMWDLEKIWDLEFNDKDLSLWLLCLMTFIKSCLLYHVSIYKRGLGKHAYLHGLKLDNEFKTSLHMSSIRLLVSMNSILFKNTHFLCGHMQNKMASGLW